MTDSRVASLAALLQQATFADCESEEKLAQWLLAHGVRLPAEAPSEGAILAAMHVVEGCAQDGFPGPLRIEEALRAAYCVDFGGGASRLGEPSPEAIDAADRASYEHLGSVKGRGAEMVHWCACGLSWAHKQPRGDGDDAWGRHVTEMQLRAAYAVDFRVRGSSQETP
jgi:hypothetical protein